MSSHCLTYMKGHVCNIEGFSLCSTSFWIESCCLDWQIPCNPDMNCSSRHISTRIWLLRKKWSGWDEVPCLLTTDSFKFKHSSCMWDWPFAIIISHLCHLTLLTCFYLMNIYVFVRPHRLYPLQVCFFFFKQ